MRVGGAIAPYEKLLAWMLAPPPLGVKVSWLIDSKLDTCEAVQVKVDSPACPAEAVTVNEIGFPLVSFSCTREHWESVQIPIVWPLADA